MRERERERENTKRNLISLRLPADMALGFTMNIRWTQVTLLGY
jgi:hypothetical protein